MDWHVPMTFDFEVPEHLKNALIFVEPKAPALRQLLLKIHRDTPPHSERCSLIPTVALHPYGK